MIKAECDAGLPGTAKFSEFSETLRKFGDRGFGRAYAPLRDILNGLPSQSTQACRRLKLQNAMRSTNVVTRDSRWFKASSRRLLATAIGDNMTSANLNAWLDRLRERWSDPLLTTLTVLLILMLFVFAPLQAVGIKLFQLLGFASALGIIGGVFLTSGSPAVAVALLAAFVMAATAAISRLHSPSILDIYLLSGAFLIMGIVLVCVVARAVFSPGRVNYHRIIGAILIYLSIALTFVALYSFVGLLVPNAFSGMTFEDNPALASKVIYFSFVTLTSTGYGDVFPLHPVARSLCNLETIIGQLYPATLLARLVSLEIEGRR
jgi:Ion channel